MNALALVAFLAAAVPGQAGGVAVEKKSTPTVAYPGWHLGVQAWTFRKFTFFETLDRIAGLGLKVVEAFPGQPLAKELPGARLHHTMSADLRAKVKARLAATGVRILNYGVVGLPADEKKCRQVFEFARAMGIRTVVSEPPAEALDLVERLCVEYGIGMAIHNHPAPSRYWDPKRVAAALKGRSHLLGACADTGHWMRSGMKPIECMRLLEGRIRSFHFKDRSDFGKESATVHDVPWGTGKADVPALLAEARRQGFSGVFSIEYEYNWDASLPEVAGCVKAFNRIAGKLPRPAWHDVFKPGLKGALFKPGTWTYEKGLLTRRGGGDIWTKARYGNFILECEFKIAKGANSGVFLRTADLANWLNTAIEVQVLDSYGRKKPSKHDCGAIFDIQEPAANAVKAPGEWNRYRITAIGPRIRVELNGVAVIDLDLDLWTEAHKNPDGTRNKFNIAYAKMGRSGHFGFQDHGNPVSYRGIRVLSFD